MRVGGLSAKDHRKNFRKSTFHSAPANYGVYAFIYPYYEPFLAMWNEKNRKEIEINGIRNFEYDGYVWCHFTDHTKSALRVKELVNVHTSELESIIKKYHSTRLKEHRWDYYNKMQNSVCNFSCDEFEVFIEKI